MITHDRTSDRKRELRLLDRCLEVLEDAREREVAVLPAALASRLTPYVGPLTPGMPISDAMDLVFRRQARYVGADDAEGPVGRVPGRWPSPAAELVDEPHMDEAEARQLTDRIRAATRQVCDLLLEAHQRRAWLALGYGSWEQYVQREFSISRSRSYELLDQARVIHELRDAAGTTSIPNVSTHAAMQIKPRLVEITEIIRQQAGSTPSPDLADFVARLVEQYRRQAARQRQVSRARRALRAAARPAGVDHLSDAIDLLASMPPPDRAVALMERSEQPRIEDYESALRWLADFVGELRRQQDPSGVRTVAARSVVDDCGR